MAGGAAQGSTGVRTEDPLLPEPVTSERGPILARTLRALPDRMLVALDRGLEHNGDRLVAGRLFRASDGGGCAVGVMLRELEPQAYRGRLRFWVRHGWRRRAGSYRGVLRANPRLRHLEWVFDGAVSETRRALPQLSRRDAAAAVGAWIRAESRRELAQRALFRRLAAGTAVAPPPPAPAPAAGYPVATAGCP